MNMYQRWLCVCCLAVLIIGVASCSPAAPAGVPPTSSAPAEITWAFWGDPEEQRINQEVLNQFRKAYPHIKVTVRHELWEDYFSTVTPSLNTNTPPDVLFLFNIPSWAKDGVLENLQPYIDRDKVNLADYWPELLDSYRYDGKLYGLPRDNDTNILYYNKQLLADAGLTAPSEKTTWDEFRATLEALRVQSGGQTERYGLAMESGKWRHWLWQTGHGVLDNNTNPTSCLLDEPDSIEAITWFTSLIQDGLVLTGAALEQAGGDREAFLSGKAAMMIQNASRIPIFNKTEGLSYALAPLPVREGWRRAGQTGGAGFVIAANSSNKEAAWTFLKWLQSQEGQTALASQSGGLVPALQSVARSDAIMKLPPEGRDAFVLETEAQAPHDGKFPEWNQLITEIIDPDIELIFNGHAQAETLLPETCRKVEEFLKASGYPQ